VDRVTNVNRVDGGYALRTPVDAIQEFRILTETAARACVLAHWDSICRPSGWLHENRRGARGWTHYRRRDCHGTRMER
jgi:hypothetical protein